MNKRSHFIFVPRFIICTLFLSAMFHCAAATIVWTNTTGGTWSAAANWDPNVVPGSSDDVLITSNGTYSVTVDTTVTVNTLVLGATNGVQTLSAPSSPLTLNNASVVDTNGILFLGGATLTVSNLTVQGQLNWFSGMATVGGSLAIGSNGRLYLTNATTCYLSGVLTNNGTIVMGATNGSLALYGYDPVRLYNNGLWISQSDNSRQFINADGLTNKLILNTGTFRQTGSGTTTFGWPFTTTGTFDQQAGSLDVQLWMGFNILHGTMDWLGGPFATNTTLTVAADGIINLTNATTFYLYGTLTNNGTVRMGGDAGAVSLYAYDPARIYNNALWLSQSGNSRQLINADGLTNKLFVNTGTFQQTGSGTTTLDWPFTTTGTFDQQGGLLSVSTWIGASVLHGSPNFNNAIGSAGTTVTVANSSVVNTASGATFNGVVTVDSGGLINLTNTGTYYLYGTLTNNGTFVMGGAVGSVQLYGYDLATICNNGLWISQSGSSRQFVNADGLTNKLFLNTGTFRQTGSANTVFGWPFQTTGTFDHQGGLLDMSSWVGASVLHGSPDFNNAVGSAGTTVAVANSSVVNTANGATFNGTVTVDSGGLINLTNTGTYYLYGTLTNNGTVVMGGAGGSVQLYGYDQATVYNNNLWISQSGSSRQFVNADGLTNKLFLNTGTFRQTGSANTLFGWPFQTTGTFDHQGGLLDVPTWIGANILRGTPIFNNLLGSPGATLTIATNAAVRSAANGTLYGGVTVDLGGTLYLTNNGTYSLYGMLTNNGTVVMGGADGPLQLYSYDLAKIFNNGLWISQSDNNRQFINADGLTNKLFVNSGTFRQTGIANTLFVSPFTTTGIIDQQGGLLDVQIWIGSNVLHGDLAFNNLLGSPGASVTVASGSVVRSTANGTLNGIVAVDSGGWLNLTNAGTYTSYGILTNNGTVVMGGSDGTVLIYGYDPTRVYNNGLWLAQCDFTRQFVNADGLTNKLFANSGTFRQTGSATTVVNWSFNSSGTTEVQGGSLNMTALFSQTAGLTLLDGGNLSSTQPYLLLGGSLSGTNTITADVTNNSVINPGLPTGKLSIVGNYNQTTNGTLQIDLGGTLPGVTFDLLTVSGTAHYGGTLVVSLTNSFVPITNSLFNIITGGPKVSAFDHFYFPSNTIGAQVVYNGNITSILVSNAPPIFGPYIYNGNFIAHFYGIPGTNYTVEWTPGLPTTNWQKLTNIIAPFTDIGLGTGVVEMVDPVTISNRFYRTVTPAY